MRDSWYNPDPEEIERTKRVLRLATPFQMASYCTDDTFADILSDAVNLMLEEEYEG